MSDEPKRLLLTEEGRLAAGLAVARRQGPSDAALAALAERLVQAGVALPEDIVQGTAHPTAPPSAPLAPNAPSSSGLMKVVLAGVPIVAIALIAGGLLRAKSPPDARSDEPLAPLQGASPAPARAPMAPAAEAAARIRSPAAPAPPIAASPTREPSGNPTSVESAAPVEPEARANARPAAPPSEAPARTQAEPRAEPKVRSGASEPTPARTAALAAGPTNRDSASDNSGSSLPDATPESEIELLKRARNTLPADPARALAITERCADLYPRGNFTQERDFIAISALFRVGRRHEALSRAERFRSSYPKSVYLPQLERMQAAP